MDNTSEETLETLSFDEILVEALIANTALARSLPRSNASEALKERIAQLRQEARRRDALMSQALALSKEIESLEAQVAEQKGRARARSRTRGAK